MPEPPIDGNPTENELTRASIDQSSGPLVLEFGASWCGHCRTLAPHLERHMAQHPDIPLIWIEDGPGKPLGRSFRVKLWPTLVFLRDGQVIRQLVRPEPVEVRRAFEELDRSDPSACRLINCDRPANPVR